jgi:[ribosomal protein S18]-alanine N-acetyltransferase
MAGDRDEKDRGRVPQSIGFSPLKPEDLASILDIERACFTQPWSEDAFRDIVAGRGFGSLAARSAKGELMGYIVFLEAADELHILNVATHPRFRRLGVASAMLSRIHQYGQERGRDFSYLEVRESNKAAQDLYAKFGYALLTKRHEYYSDNQEDAILMVAVLNPRRRWRR